jgi:DNA-binding NarL/FixJ family response regulator
VSFIGTVAYGNGHLSPFPFLSQSTNFIPLYFEVALDILLVDDNSRFRMLVKRLIAESINPDTVVYECANGDDALKTYTRRRPHWVVMDIELGETNGLTTTRAILDQDPGAKIIVISQYREPVYRQAAEEAGACAFLLKDDLPGLATLLKGESETQQTK